MIDFALILPVQTELRTLEPLDPAIDCVSGVFLSDELADTWGTRTNPASFYESENEEENVTRCSTRVVFSFRSAWTPPIDVIDAAARQYPALRFSLANFGELGTEYESDTTVEFPIIDGPEF